MSWNTTMTILSHTSKPTNSTKQPATNPVPPAGTPPPAPKPGADDRLDEGGDGGSTAPDDPNDFAQQVIKN
jgi:hypothetical protein